MGTKKIDNDLDFQGSKIVNAKMDTFNPAIEIVATATVLGATHCTVILSAATNTTDVTFSLPSAATATGRIHQLIANKGNIIIAVIGGGAVKDGEETVSIIPWKKKVTIQSDGTTWHSLTVFGPLNPTGEPPAIFDEFMNVPPSIVSGAAATVSLISPDQTNRIGVIRLATGTTATGSAFIGDVSQSTTVFGQGAITYAAAVKVSSLSSVLQRHQILVGFFTQTTQVNQLNGIYFLYDEGGVSTGSTASSSWQRVTAATGIRTFATTTSVVVANGWNNLRIEVDSTATSVDFYINGVLVGTSTTNIPSGLSGFCGPGILIRKSIGTTSASVQSDWTFLRANYTRLPRGTW
jgi:hypothetical protein